ncbi:MAG: LysR family transcriptional regulator [Comamonadaceae bacterium]|nr:LysR family transcriptional regulator [Comamonadaceae bacterium]
MEFRQLRYFVEVASAGSINSAATRLGIAQSAVSRQVTELEKELGVLLLRRHREGISLTPGGEKVIRGATAILGAMDALIEEVRTDSDELLSVRMGMPPSVSPLLLDAISLTLRSAPVPMSVQLVEGSSFWLQQRLDAGDLACAVLTNGRSSRTVSSTPLWRESLFLLGPSDSPLRGRKSCKLADISTIPLTLTPAPDTTRLVINAAFAAAGLQPLVVQEHEAMTLLTNQLATRSAYTILSRTVVVNLQKQLGLIAIPIRGLTVDRVFSVRRGALPTRAVGKVVSVLRDAARQRYSHDKSIVVSQAP